MCPSHTLKVKNILLFEGRRKFTCSVAGRGEKVFVFPSCGRFPRTSWKLKRLRKLVMVSISPPPFLRHSEIVAVGLQPWILNWVEANVFWPRHAVAYGVGLSCTLQDWAAFPVPAPACGKLDAATSFDSCCL